MTGRQIRGPRWEQVEGSIQGWVLGMVLLAVVGGALGLWVGPAWRYGTAPDRATRDGQVPPGETISLWFASQQEEALLSEQRRIAPGLLPVERAKAALQELIAGPKGEALRTLAAEVKVRELFIDGQGTAYVDFTEALSRYHPGGSWSEILTIRSVMQTLVANVPEIKQVQFLIEGREVDTLAGHIDIRRPLATTWAIDQR